MEEIIKTTILFGAVLLLMTFLVAFNYNIRTGHSTTKAFTFYLILCLLAFSVFLLGKLSGLAL